MSLTTYSVVVDNQVLIYVRGVLIHKRWLDHGVSATFHIAPKGVRWSTHPLPPT